MTSFKVIVLIGLSASIFIFSCNPKVGSVLYTGIELHPGIIAEDLPEDYKSPCKEPLNYAPIEDYLKYFDKRTVRINFHFPDDSTRSNNFNVGEGEEFFTNMVNNCNYRFEINKKMNLPEGNTTPNLNPHFQLQITPSKEHIDKKGFYYETDNEDAYFINKGRDRNNYNKSIIKKYAIDEDTILNAFIMPHHPDSLRSETYKTFGSGIALGSSVKVAGIFQLGGKDWAYATLLNHEVGHVFGLSHSWNRDGCDDTPQHANCFYETGVPPCDGPVSNNLMDYNNSQMAITPCQIGRMHMKIADTTAFQRKLVIPTWCKLDSTSIIVINDRVEWKGGRDVSKHILIENGGELVLHCRLSLPKNGKIVVNPGGVLRLIDVTLHNDCGDLWKGIEIRSNGSEYGMVYKSGEVNIFDVLNNNAQL